MSCLSCSSCASAPSHSSQRIEANQGGARASRLKAQPPAPPDLSTAVTRPAPSCTSTACGTSRRRRQASASVTTQQSQHRTERWLRLQCIHEARPSCDKAAKLRRRAPQGASCKRCAALLKPAHLQAKSHQARSRQAKSRQGRSAPPSQVTPRPSHPQANYVRVSVQGSFFCFVFFCCLD